MRVHWACRVHYEAASTTGFARGAAVGAELWCSGVHPSSLVAACSSCCMHICEGCVCVTCAYVAAASVVPLTLGQLGTCLCSNSSAAAMLRCVIEQWHATDSRGWVLFLQVCCVGSFEPRAASRQLQPQPYRMTTSCHQYSTAHPHRLHMKGSRRSGIAVVRCRGMNPAASAFLQHSSSQPGSPTPPNPCPTAAAVLRLLGCQRVVKPTPSPASSSAPVAHQMQRTPAWHGSSMRTRG